MYVLKDGVPVEIPVEIGATDGTVTEITKGDLAEGAEVVVDDAGAAPAAGALGGGGQRRGPRVF